jgi:hypothetical protein
MKQKGEKSMPLSDPQALSLVGLMCCKAFNYNHKQRACLPARSCLLGSKKE